MSLALMLCAAARADQGHGIRFTETTQEGGLIEPLVGMMGHGGAWGDYDGDGRVDLFVGGFCDRPASEYAPADGPVAAKLLRQVEGGRFVLADEPVASVHARTSGALFADLDNDGALELYIANNARPGSTRTGQPQREAQLQRSMLLSMKGGKLIDVSTASGACPEGLLSARNVLPLDFDRDGRLDLLVIEDRFVGRGKTPRTVLLRNIGGLRFEIANAAAGFPDDVFGLGAAVADLNEDGYPDIFIPHSNRMFLSKGDGTYREATELRKVFEWLPLDGEDWPCGAAFGDLNGDGRLDLLLSIHHVKARNRIFINDGLNAGVPRFRDVTEHTGLATVPVRCPHVELQDFDNDGRLDIYLSAAWRDGDTVTPLVYRNLGNDAGGLPRFVPPRPVPERADGADGQMVYYPAGPSADYDRDGRIDLFLVNWFAGDRCRLLRNTTAAGHWLRVRVVGTRTLNRSGIGAKVRVYVAGKAGDPAALCGYQEVAAGYGYASGQEAMCHFGLGETNVVDLIVTLPDGRTIERKSVKADQQIVIEEP